MKVCFLAMMALSAVLTAGCDAPEAVSTPTTTTATQSPSSTSTAPVATDIRRYLDRPCELLGSNERATFGLQVEPVQEITDRLSICSWSGGTVEMLFNLSTIKTPLEISPLEAAEGLSWEPRLIEGQSAGIRQQKPSRQHCELAIETGPRQGIYLVYKGKTANVDWCGKAVELGEIMVRRLRAG